MSANQTNHHPSNASTSSGHISLSIKGMSCTNCARQVTEAIQSARGVSSAQVSLEQHQATVRWNPRAQPDVGAVIQAIEAAGFHATPVKAPTTSSSSPARAGAATWKDNVIFSALPAGALIIGEWLLQLSDVQWFRWSSLIIAAVAQLGPGRHFYHGAWNQLKFGRSNMDTLVSLGSTTAFLYSAWALFAGTEGHLYFMEAASIIALVSVGHWIEARVSANASSSLRALMNLAPQKARRRNDDDSEEDVPVDTLQIKDRVLLKPGDRVPTDGELLEGNAAVDESMLTGESFPVEKAPESKLYAGTTNLNGRLLMRVTSTGETTALAQIISAVARAQSSRANIQRLGDRVSAVFVPIVVVTAFLAALWWGLMPETAREINLALTPYFWSVSIPASTLASAVIVACAVLIIACPCAMGLATPAAIMAGSNAAAKRGILIRDGVALEKAGKVTTLLFDKTGTLTVGKPFVTRVQELNRSTLTAHGEAAAIAAAMASFSTHPLSQAVHQLHQKKIGVNDWEEIAGCGLQGRLADSRQERVAVRLGSLRWLASSGVDISPCGTLVDEWSSVGATLLGYSENNILILLFALQDTLKPRTPEVIRRLREQHYSVHLVTGDDSRTAMSIARQAGIEPDNVFAEVRPEAKADLVKKLQMKNQRVAFVGDGINDAPALQQANLGIAVSRASDIAREAADIILLRSDIEAVPESLGLANATLKTIKQNLFWAFFYNALGIPLAALGFLSPILCAAAMGMSDLVVLGNALRLRTWKL